MKKEKRLFHRKKPTDSDDQYILHLIKLYLKFGKEPIPRSEMYPDEYSSNDGKIFAENLRDFLGKNLYYDWNAAISSLQGEQAAKIAELEAKLAEVEKNAERYNWLCDHCVDFEEFTEGDSFTVKSLHFEYSPKLYLHQAIDAAIQESKKGGAV